MCRVKGVRTVLLSAVAAFTLVTPAVVRSSETAHVYATTYLSPFLNLGAPAYGWMDLAWYDPPSSSQDGYVGSRALKVYCESALELRLDYTRASGLPTHQWAAWLEPCLVAPPGAVIAVGLRLEAAVWPPGEYYVGRLSVYDLDHPPGTAACFPLLPSSAGDDGWQFRFSVGDAADPVFIDPLVAIGYDYFVDSGPSFASVLLPSVGDNVYDLWLWDDAAVTWIDSGVDLTGGSQHDFISGGVSRFRILGIEAAVGLDPLDDTAFVTALWFTDTGSVSMRQVPISFDTEAVPAPGALVLLCVGLAGLNAVRRNVA